jgi:hypothetical protein
MLGTKGWTVHFRPWKVIYCEFFDDKKLASGRKKELKGGRGREWIHDRIREEYPSVGPASTKHLTVFYLWNWALRIVFQASNTDEYDNSLDCI